MFLLLLLLLFQAFLNSFFPRIIVFLREWISINSPNVIIAKSNEGTFGSHCNGVNLINIFWLLEALTYWKVRAFNRIQEHIDLVDSCHLGSKSYNFWGWFYFHMSSHLNDAHISFNRVSNFCWSCVSRGPPEPLWSPCQQPHPGTLRPASNTATPPTLDGQLVDILIWPATV